MVDDVNNAIYIAFGLLVPSKAKRSYTMHTVWMRLFCYSIQQVDWLLYIIYHILLDCMILEYSSAGGSGMSVVWFLQ